MDFPDCLHSGLLKVDKEDEKNEIIISKAYYFRPSIFVPILQIYVVSNFYRYTKLFKANLMTNMLKIWVKEKVALVRFLDPFLNVPRWMIFFRHNLQKIAWEWVCI